MDQNNNFIPQEQVSDNSHSSIFVTILVGFLSALLGAGAVFGAFYFYPDLASKRVTNINKTEKEVTVTDTGIADAVEKIYHSVVVVKNYRRNRLYSTGTGFVYKKEGENKYYLLTNFHVIENGDRVSVMFTNGEEVDVKVESGDKYADIAVLSMISAKEYQPAKIADLSKVRVGDTVFAIGAPLDSSVYSWSVTRGVLSGKDRKVEVSTNNSSVSDWIMHVLQTDAAINSGNSGGPLCNSNGEVIGITNMKLVTNGVEGMGFAIPINEAKSYADSVIGGEDLKRPLIGITMADVTDPYISQEYNINLKQGVFIVEVQENSNASRAGLLKGDIITAINDVQIKNMAALKYELYKYKNGDTISVKFVRNGRVQTVKMKLSA